MEIHNTKLTTYKEQDVNRYTCETCGRIVDFGIIEGGMNVIEQGDFYAKHIYPLYVDEDLFKSLGISDGDINKLKKDFTFDISIGDNENKEKHNLN